MTDQGSDQAKHAGGVSFTVPGWHGVTADRVGRNLRVSLSHAMGPLVVAEGRTYRDLRAQIITLVEELGTAIGMLQYALAEEAVDAPLPGVVVAGEIFGSFKPVPESAP